MKLLSAKTRLAGAIAICLALTAGYLDGYGLLVLGTYVSFMSGNSTSAGLRTGQGHFNEALPSAVAIVSFVMGSFVGNLITHCKLRHSHRLIFGLIGSLVLTVAILVQSRSWDHISGVAMLSVGMGLLNPALTKVGAEPVSLTFVTGTLSRIGGHLASAAARKPLGDPLCPRDSHLRRARIEASVWLGFLAGALLSGIALSHFPRWAAFPACAFFIALSILCPADDSAASLKWASEAIHG